MKINEVTDRYEKIVDFDINGDVIVYMLNDPEFYRSEYFPAISKVCKLAKKDKSCDIKKVLKPVVDTGINRYCDKYQISHSPDELFTKEDKNDILNHVVRVERDNIQKGKYQ